jgi:hypothetical protein
VFDEDIFRGRKDHRSHCPHLLALRFQQNKSGCRPMSASFSIKPKALR